MEHTKEISIDLQISSPDVRFAKKRISKNGIQMFQPNWFYWHEDFANLIGTTIEVMYHETIHNRIFAEISNGKTVEVSLSKAISRNSKTTNYSDSHLREVIEIYRHALESISESEISLDAGIPMKEIAAEAIRKSDTIFMLHNEGITKYGGES